MGSFVCIVAPGDGREAAADAGLAAAPHRGSPLDRVTVGGATLAIGDTADPGGDASLTHDGDLTAAFTGQLDNRAELAAELGLGDEASPADVVLHAHRRWGADAPRRFRGPFASVVTDGSAVHVARDPLGLRSAFFRRDAGRVIAATEVKQVLAAAGVTPEPDLDVIEAIVFQEYDDDTPTALRGAERVPRGMTVRIDDRGALRHRYWDPRSLLETADLTADEVAERFHGLMEQAASRALLGNDVVSLSGGIDSPAVAAYAGPVYRERHGSPLPALSVVYPDFPEVDESEYIGLVVDQVGLELHTYQERSKTLDAVDEWMGVLDSPVPQFFLAESAEHYRHAHAMGYRTMLTGELAEWIVERRDYLLPHLLLHGRVGPLAHHLRLQRSRHGVKVRGMARQLAPAVMTPRIERAWTTIRPARVRIPPWVDERRLRRVEARFATPARHRWEGFQVAIFLGPDIAAEAEDVAQAVTGMRVRRPFGDLDLIEFFLSLPAEQKFPDTHYKGLLRQVLRGRVPDPLLDRPSKAVFNDAVMARADVPALRRLLIGPRHRIPGIDYDAIQRRLDASDPLQIGEYERLKNLAATQAFLARW
jgi:asparagine synthase (glutamine-hydrolysing)